MRARVAFLIIYVLNEETLRNILGCIFLLALFGSSCNSQRKIAANAKSNYKGMPASDGKQFKGHWYRAFYIKLSWQEAKKKCEEMGGYLCCIESDEEQQIVAQFVDEKRLYLGGTDEEQECTWKWINGSQWDYTKWMEGQPNNWGGDENYLATYDRGEWVDVAAEGDGFWMPIGFLCEWDK